MSDLCYIRSSILGDKTEVILLHEPLPLESDRREPPKTAFTSNTGACVCKKKTFLMQLLSLKAILLQITFRYFVALQMSRGMYVVVSIDRPLKKIYIYIYSTLTDR